MRRYAIACAILVVLVGAVAIDRILLARQVPIYPTRTRAEPPNQHWTTEQRNWFYRADQGTQTFHIPYEWFAALDQPAFSLSFAIGGLLSDPSYLDRYGFIPMSPQTGGELPIGFARGGEMRRDDGTVWLNPATHQPMTRVGLTCAACHTGRLTYQNAEFIIDGGPALTNVIQFQDAVGKALADTYVSGWTDSQRFRDFSTRVLGPTASADAMGDLKRELREVVGKYKHVHDLETGPEEGYARLDALNRIGNAVFALDAGRDENYVAHSAPVHYPKIWDASWFQWVQYNGSIEQPMARNAGEALGVSAWLDLRGQAQRSFSSSVQAQTLFEIEHLLAGTQPNAKQEFNGLTSPSWPESVLPRIDQPLAAKGAVLYEELCRSCHLPPTSSAKFWTSDRWLPPNSAGERLLNLKLEDISYVGTDPAQAEDMQRRRVTSDPALGINGDEFGSALGQVISMTMARWYDDRVPPTSPARRDEMNGNRPNGLQSLLKYKARPLDGIWATPPYLHNGSVPNLYALLSPATERPGTFGLGSREFDPKAVGYRTEQLPGGFELDTSKRGNRNTGHEFKDGPLGKGIIGRLLTPAERWALVEFLKTL